MFDCWIFTRSITVGDQQRLIFNAATTIPLILNLELLLQVQQRQVMLLLLRGFTTAKTNPPGDRRGEKLLRRGSGCRNSRVGA